jgi:hypothetical protein
MAAGALNAQHCPDGARHYHRAPSLPPSLTRHKIALQGAGEVVHGEVQQSEAGQSCQGFGGEPAGQVLQREVPLAGAVQGERVARMPHTRHTRHTRHTHTHTHTHKKTKKKKQKKKQKTTNTKKKKKKIKMR